MKSITSWTALVLLITCFTGAADAREKKARPQAATETPAITTQAAPEGRIAAPKRLALGLAGAENLVRGTALTGLWELDPTTALQAFLSIPTSSPFQMGVGGLLKYTLVEHQGAGLHAGGGLSFGAAPDVNSESGGSTFFFSLNAVAGLHLPFPGASNVMLHFDGGPAMYIQSDNSQFHIDSIGSILGLSILYFL